MILITIVPGKEAGAAKAPERGSREGDDSWSRKMENPRRGRRKMSRKSPRGGGGIEYEVLREGGKEIRAASCPTVKR